MPPIVEPVSALLEDPALELLFGHLPAVERTSAIADLRAQRDAGLVSLDEFLLARTGSRVQGVLLSVPHGPSGRFVWVPVVAPDVPPSIIDALFAAAVRGFATAAVELAQVLTETSDEATQRSLECQGFEWIADLEFMERSLDAPWRANAAALECESYDEQNRARFETLLSATYVGTLDCPGLDGRRSVGSTLEGHRACGRFDPSRWMLFRAGGADVGLLLLADHPAENSWEVVYVGVHHAHRGHGYGRRMLAVGLDRARAAGRAAVLLAVDIRNEYAIRTYVELGFVPLVRRRVHVWFGGAR